MSIRARRVERATRATLVVALVAGLALGTGLLFGSSEVFATPPVPPDSTANTADDPAQQNPENGQEAPSEDPTHATIIFVTTPPAKAVVTWGRQRLGRIRPGRPLVVKRPRDSGPLDVMVRATGYLPVQTRAQTFRDSRVIVKLTLPANKSELFGYRLPLDAGVETPEQAAALGAMGTPDGNESVYDGTFRVVPATPVLSPLLLP